MSKHIELLGKKATDRITGVTGVVTSVCFDLYGCIQATIHRGLKSDGEAFEQNWFDVSRLSVDESAGTVMDAPNFNWTPALVADGGKGPAEKPAHNSF